MQSLRNYPKIILLAMVMVFLLFTNLALGLLPASSLAVASPGPGWVEQTPFPGGQNLNAIDAVDSNTAWAVGDYGTLLRHLTEAKPGRGRTLTQVGHFVR